ncbi:hypothetical protein GW17_00017488 [Ensete ventricosum]|nr:hypothetical protein GW17_00017488 [Ensete ventricosum]
MAVSRRPLPWFLQTTWLLKRLVFLKDARKVFDRGALIRVATYGPSVFFWLCASRSRNAHHFLLTDAFGPIFISPGRRGDEDELFEGMRVCTATLLHSVGRGTPLLLRKPAHLINAPRASSPAMLSRGEKVEHDWVEGALESRSAADELALGSFYSGCYRSFVLEIFTTFIAYHVVVLLHTVRGPCSETRVLPAPAVAYRPYPCQVDCTIADSSVLVSGRLRCVESGQAETSLLRFVFFRFFLGSPPSPHWSVFSEQVEMTSSDSLSSIRIVPSPGSGGIGLGEPEASSSGASSGPPSSVDTRVLRDLEVMKAGHDLDMTVVEGSLATIKERYNIPAEYGLHILQPGQCPYSSNVPGVCISVDALEAGLWFPFYPTIEECIRWWRISPNQVTPNSWRYLIVFLGECRGTEIIPTQNLFMAYFRLCKSRGGLLSHRPCQF